MTAEELLAAMAEPLAEDGTYCTIDPETRVITIPPEYQLLGVESDEKAERIYFKCPKIVGDDIDLSKLALRVNFRNAGQVVDQYLVDDVAVDGDNITFSWLLSRRVTQYEGDVNFIVCAVRVSGETITNEWNTTLATAQVLEGLEAEMVLPEEETDIVNQLLSLAETRLNDVKEATADANTAASNANQKAQEAENAAEDARGVIEQITKDSYLHTALQSFVDSVKATPTAYGNAIVKKIEGFTRQETTKGLNLMPLEPREVNATVIITDGGKTYRVTGKNAEDSSGYVWFIIPKDLSELKGRKIYVSDYDTVRFGNGSGAVSIFQATSSGITDGIGGIQPNGFVTVPEQLREDTEFIVALLFAKSSAPVTTSDGNTFSNLWLSLDEPLETWEPYTGGQPAPNPDYPMVVQGTGYRGFFDGDGYQTIYVDSSGSQSVNTAWFLTDTIIPCEAGDRIKTLYDKKELIDYYGIVYYTDGVWKSRPADNETGEWVVPSGINGFRINCGSNNAGTFANNDLTGLYILVNDQYAVAVKSEGINILDFEKFLNSGGARYTKSGDRYRLTAMGMTFSNPIILSEEDEDFTLSGSVTSESGSGYSVQLLNKAGNTVATLRNEVKNVSGKGCKIRLNHSEAGAGIYEDIMVEKGTSHEEYIPYQSNITYIPVDYPLFEGDKIIQRNGEYKLLRKWGFKTYDGSDDENWNIVYNEENNVYNVYIADMMNDGKRSVLVPNNYFYNNEYGYALHSSYISSSGNYNIMISPDMHIDAVQEWKDWLKIHTMYCAYELATPTEGPLSPEAQKALHSIMATDEQTELTIIGIPADAEIQNQFLLPRNEDGALNTTAYCTAEKNKIVLNELVAQNLDARVNKLEIDNATLAEQTIIVE